MENAMLSERVYQTIANELKRGTTTHLKTGGKSYTAYFPETGQAVYEQNRKNCGAKSKLLVAMEFIDYDCEKILDKDWSPDTVVGHAKKTSTQRRRQDGSYSMVNRHSRRSKIR